MENKKLTLKRGLIPVLIVFLSLQAHASILGTLGDANALLYGVAAGIAALMMAVHAVKWKTSDNANDRELAKKGMINVMLAVMLILIAASLVSIVFRTPQEPAVPPTTTQGNQSHSTTTTILKVTTTSTTTSTTTTTINPAKLLTAANLVKCINRAGGKLISNPQTCHPCMHQKLVFVNDGADGQAAYNSLDKPTPSGGIPRWEWTSNGEPKKVTGCQTFSTLNGAHMFNCKLIPVPGHNYQACY